MDSFCDPVWIRTKDLLLRRQLLYPTELRDHKKKGDDYSSPTSGRQDSNLRPPGPKPGAMTGLRYAPNSIPKMSIQSTSLFSVLRFTFVKLRHEPCGFSSLSTSTLLRWERDSNPRYGYPYDSLANCWFQPLTHPTSSIGRQK